MLTTDSSLHGNDIEARRSLPRILLSRAETKSQFFTPESKRVTLNVSGLRFQTYEDTLNNFPETLLGCPEKRDQFYNARTREFVFARSKCAFDSILFYYQSQGILCRPDTITAKEFDDELQFYEIENPDPIALMAREGKDIEEVPASMQAEPGNLKTRMWCVLEYPHSSWLGQLIAVCSILVILFSVVIFCLETLPMVRRDEDSDLWFTFETICVVWFLTEYLCRLYSAPVRRKFIFSSMGIVDLLAILPYLLTLPLKNELDDVRSFVVMRALRLFRVLRVFKLSRYSVGFKVLLFTIVDSLEQMRSICFCTLIAVIIYGSVIYVVEGPTNTFSSIPESTWWAVQTMSSVGYGDIVPLTTPGRLVGALCAVSGILLFCLPTPILVANFLKHYTRAFFSSPETLSEQQKRLVDNMKKLYLSSNR